MLIGADAPGMGGIEAVHQAVQEPPPWRGPFGKQFVHTRRQPLDTQVFGQHRLAPRRLAVDADGPLFRSPAGRGRIPEAGADLDPPPRRGNLRRHRPRPGGGSAAVPLGAGLPPGHVAQARPPQAAAGNQERYRLQQVGLAGAVGPGEHHRPRIGLQSLAAEAAEVRQGQAGDRKACRDTFTVRLIFAQGAQFRQTLRGDQGRVLIRAWA